MLIARYAFGLLAAGVAALPASAQIQIQVQPGGGAQPKIIINGKEAAPGQAPKVRPAVAQRDEVVKQLEKAIEDLKSPSDKVDLEQVRKDLADAVSKLKQMPVGPQVLPGGGGIRIVPAPGQPIPPRPVPPAKQPEL